MKKIQSKRGFTLIEMLVVIAIVAVLVAIVIPAVTSAGTRAKAAADAANLRSIYGEANTAFITSSNDNAMNELARENIQCSSFPNAEFKLAFTDAGYISVYFVDGENFYSLDYFVSAAQNGTPDPSISTADPTAELERAYGVNNVTWYPLSD